MTIDDWVAGFGFNFVCATARSKKPADIHMKLLTQHQLTLLLDQKSISAQHPWSSNTESVVYAFYKNVCDDIIQTAGASSKIEWDHYGSGYASYIDAWFYQDVPDFRDTDTTPNWKGYRGLVVLLSSLSPYFVFMEGSKNWDTNSKSASGYMPSFEYVDDIPSPSVLALSKQVQPILERHGLQRLSRAELSTLLPAGTQVPTILGDPPFTEYDAIFYWAD